MFLKKWTEINCSFMLKAVTLKTTSLTYRDAVADCQHQYL